MSTCHRPGCQSFGTGYKPDGTHRSSCVFLCINGAHVGEGEGQDCICESCQQALLDISEEKESPVGIQQGKMKTQEGYASTDPAYLIPQISCVPSGNKVFEDSATSRGVTERYDPKQKNANDPFAHYWMLTIFMKKCLQLVVMPHRDIWNLRFGFAKAGERKATEHTPGGLTTPWTQNGDSLWDSPVLEKSDEEFQVRKLGGQLRHGGLPYLVTQHLVAIMMGICAIIQRQLKWAMVILFLVVRDHVEASRMPLICVETLHAIVVILHPHMVSEARMNDMAPIKLIHRSGRNTALGKDGSEVFMRNSIVLLTKPGGSSC